MFDTYQAFAADSPTLSAWLATIGSAVLAALVALVAYRAVWIIASRLTNGRVFAGRVLRYARVPGRIVVVLLALQFALDAVPPGLPRLAIVEHFTTLLLTIALAWLGMRCVRGVADAIIATHPLSVTDNLDASGCRPRLSSLRAR